MAILTAAAVLLVPAKPARADAASDMVSMVNAERTSRGLAALVVHSDLVAGAERQANAIADAGYLYHTGDLGSITDGWRSMGENVGYGGSVSSVHSALMDSDGHRANILDPDYTHIGIGVVSADGLVWIAQVFMESTTPAVYEGSFYDDEGSVHEASIEALLAAGITSGCGDGRFCPDDAVTRGQMAAFLQRAMNLPNVGGNPFSDDDSSVFEDAIEALAAAEITSGCGSGRFCPDDAVTRGQMAAFLTRALGLPPAEGNPFSDDNGSLFEDSIESLAAAGITVGCGDGRFCPGQPVTRAEMATFLVRAFGL
jgi:hypothetical protein